MIQQGFACFEKSLEDRDQTRFHIEAAIAAIHARAASYDETEWLQILRQYDVLAQAYPSPIVELNRAVALSFVEGAEAALDRLREFTKSAPGKELETYYLYPATLAKFHAELDHKEEASSFYRKALELPCSEPERRLLQQRLRELG